MALLVGPSQRSRGSADQVAVHGRLVPRLSRLPRLSRRSTTCSVPAVAFAVKLGVFVANRARRRKCRVRCILTPVAAAPVESDSVDPTEVGASLVKIFVTRQRASLAVPWQSQQVESTSGSGTFIMRAGKKNQTQKIPDADDSLPPYWSFSSVSQAVGDFDGNLILTAAHVVADARDIRIQLLACPGASPDKFPARVVSIAHDSDLALLQVMDDSCFAGANPMELVPPNEILSVQSRIQVIGFPIGGDYLSITEGVLSRVEVVDYSHSRRSCLAMTVDAAINAGNSGGPVVDPVTGRLAGVAHQKLVALGVENQGHAVPPCLIWRFLYGATHGRVPQMPSLGVYLQTLESAAHREALNLERHETGILIKEVNLGPGDSASELEPGDVLLQVGPYKVDNFSTVRFLGHRVPLSAVHDLWYIGDPVKLQVRRDGKTCELKAPLRHATHLVPRCLYGAGVFVQPEFFIFAGLVFVPLTADFLEQAWPNAQDRPPHLMDLFYSGTVTAGQRQAVVLLSILADDVNAGHGTGYVGAPVIHRVAGQPVLDLMELAVLLREAARTQDFVEIEYVMGVGPYSMVLKSSEIAEADIRIQQLYQLPDLASANLLM